MTLQERTQAMLMMYGEVCSRSEAARMLRKDSRTINAMLADGRLEWACGGTMVDVRSIAQFIHSPAQAEETGRINRLKRRVGSDYVVV